MLTADNEVEESQDDMDFTEKTISILNSLFDQLNQMGGDKEIEAALKSVLHVQHRTLKQNFMRQIIVPSIRIFAEQDAKGYKDLRNEAACELATKLLPIVEKSPLPYI